MTPSEIWTLVLGGGGGVAIFTTFLTYLKDRRKESRMDEDTAIQRLLEDYRRKEREAVKAWRLLNWFRYHYPLLWHAYMQTPDAEKERFPPTPPPDIDS